MDAQNPQTYARGALELEYRQISQLSSSSSRSTFPPSCAPAASAAAGMAAEGPDVFPQASSVSLSQQPLQFSPQTSAITSASIKTSAWARQPARWTSEMKKALLEAIHTKGVLEGNRADSGFKQRVWDYALEEVRRVNPACQLTGKQLRSKYDACKADWKEWVQLTSLSGVSVDEDGRVLADPLVLETYFRAHPKARKFEREPLEYQNLHQQLFEGVLATGARAALPRDLIASVESQSPAPEEALLSPRRWESSASNIVGRRKRPGAIADDKSRKRNQREHLAGHIKALTTSLSKMVSVARRDLRAEAVTAFMDSFGELDDSLLYGVLESFGDVHVAQIFLLLPANRRTNWLKTHLNKLRSTGAISISKEDVWDAWERFKEGIGP